MKTKPFDLQECIEKHGGRAYIESLKEYIPVSILSTETNVKHGYPIIVIDDAKKNIYYVSENGCFYNSPHGASVVLPVITKSLYWNINYDDDGDYYIAHQYGFESEDEAKLKINDNRYLKTIKIDIEE